MDFALWKARKTDDEPAWESPWGLGRPGWHIECSAMAKKYLGDTIDIHAGGMDLSFPHHENEIAQSEALNGKTFANYWMHNAYITINDEKMSKSKGNFFTVRDILKQYTGEEVRFFLLSGHYRSPVNFSDELMAQTRNALVRMYNAKENLKYLTENGVDDISESERVSLANLTKYRDRFDSAMEDDINTADAISVIFELIKDVNTQVREGSSKKYAKEALAELMELANVMGILYDEDTEDSGISEDIKALVEERQEARKLKNFVRADEIRDILKQKGYAVEDTAQGAKLVKL